jgi:hypothetical protein
VTKNFSDSVPSVFTVLSPNLERVCPDIQHFEPSIARLSSSGTTVYIIGVTTVCRYDWCDSTLKLDENWSYDYATSTGQDYGWDGVIDIPNNNFWFMDNGRHNYLISMIEAGVNPTPNRLIRISLTESRDSESILISQCPHGSVTNPPLIDPERKIVVAFDSSNRYMSAYRYATEEDSTISSNDVEFVQHRTTLTPLWSKSNFGVASHMIFYSKPGYFFANNYRYWWESVVLLDILTGQEISSVWTGGFYQGVVFPSIGWNNDVYWVTIGRISRIFISSNKCEEDSSKSSLTPKISLPLSFGIGCLALATFLGASWYEYSVNQIDVSLILGFDQASFGETVSSWVVVLFFFVRELFIQDDVSSRRRRSVTK